MQQITVSIFFAVLLLHINAFTVQQGDIWDIISKDNRFQTLATAITAADLILATRDIGPYTVFAPTEVAFAKVPPATIQSALDPQNKDALARLLSYHAIGNRNLTAAQLLEMHLPTRLETLIGESVTVSRQGSQVKINDATVIAADIMARNGIIHAIDTVLLPPEL